MFNYGRAFLLLTARYARRDRHGVVRCADCGGRMDEHEMWCRGYFHAQQLLKRALREMGRNSP